MDNNNINCNHNYEHHGRNDQIVFQFLLKTLHVILDSRVPSFSLSFLPSKAAAAAAANNNNKKSDRWFNLALGEHPPTALTFWQRNLMEPMVIDIILVQPFPHDQSGYGALTETVIERWVVQYEYSSSASASASRQSSNDSYKKTYKKSIILLRSLYSMLRLLPAYRAFRRSSKAKDFHITYKLSSFAVPFTRSEEQLMKQYAFFPIDAQHGRLSVSVRYRESLSDFNLETSASLPPQIITDYVGSPATDPFRAFPPVREMLQRPHSWTGGGPFTKNQSPPAHHSSSGRYDLSSSPSSSPYDVYTRTPTPHSFDDSPPTYLSSSTGGSYMQSRLRSETAPVSIPNPLITRTPRYLSPNLSDPNRHSLPPLSPRSTSHESSPAAVRSLKKSDMSRVGDLSHKVLSRDNKDDSGRFSGLLSSSGSPRIGFSRSSSRLSLQDELDDIDFSCPFIVDDVDTCDSPVSRSGVGGRQGKKSQDAAVGALVRMLRTAPPLRQDSSYCIDHVENTSGLFMSRKTSDALEELRAYTGIKHLILSKSKDTL